jgi:hypothetical protein
MAIYLAAVVACRVGICGEQQVPFACTPVTRYMVPQFAPIIFARSA